MKGRIGQISTIGEDKKTHKENRESFNIHAGQAMCVVCRK